MDKITFCILAFVFGLIFYIKCNDQMSIFKGLNSDESRDGVEKGQKKPMTEEANEETVPTEWSSYLPRGAENGYTVDESLTIMFEKKIAEDQAKMGQQQIPFYVTVMKRDVMTPDKQHDDPESVNVTSDLPAADENNASRSSIEVHVFLLNIGEIIKQESPIANATSVNASVVHMVDDASYSVSIAHSRLVIVIVMVLVLLCLKIGLFDMFAVIYSRRIEIGDGDKDFVDSDNDDDGLEEGLGGDDLENGLGGNNFAAGRMDTDKLDITKMLLVPMTG